MSISPVVLGPELEQRLAGTPLLVLLDVDGTLAPIVSRHDQATVPAATRHAVAALVSRPGVHVALVSGRAAADASRMVGVEGVWAVGNHGCETIAPDGSIEVDPQVAPYQPAMAKVAGTLEQLIAMIPGAALENKTWTLTLHYRLADPGIVPRLQGAVAELSRRHGLRMTEGKKIYELRPPVHVDKGTAALALARKLGAVGEGASLIFAGDDATDEDGFRFLRAHAPQAVTVRVADGEISETAAELTVPGTEGMRELLEWLAAVRR